MANFLIKFRVLITLFFDLLAGFVSLLLMIFVRYGSNGFRVQFINHLLPFFVVALLCIWSFYIFNLYSPRFNRNITEFNDSFIKSIIVSLSISILIFYIYGSFFNLTPKTNLILFMILFGSVNFAMRILIRRYYSRRKISRSVVIVGTTHNHLKEEIKSNETIGYEIIKEIAVFDYNQVLKNAPDIVIVDSLDTEVFDNLYLLLKKNISIYTLQMFHEETFQKIPIEIIDKHKIIEYMGKNGALFVFLKRFTDVMTSLIFIIVLSPLLILIALLIKITSKGSILFRQIRIGIHDTEFTLYKFRSMYINSEKDGAVWTKDEKMDTRITPLGRILRKTHLDELPQLINILRGDISFVGPRPERPEFTQILNKEIMYYNLRHSVKPGLTGWAQINYRYGSSVEDAKEKLKFDFYYIKNRNIFLDILIILKTAAMILIKH